MKKTLLLLVSLLSVLSLSASVQREYNDTVCDGHKFIYVQDNFFDAFSPGEYYFVSDTWQLPLTVYYYPDNENAQAPDIWLDLTCKMDGKSYDDIKVAEMVAKAGQYHLSFPMKETLNKEYVDGKPRYRITYDVNYRNMLYGEGVTYSIPAYVHFVCYAPAEIEIVSRSVATRCRDYVNTLPMNTSLKFVPEDGESIYLWQIGEWVDKQYRFVWDSEAGMTMIDGKDCLVELNNGYQLHKYVFPTNFVMRRQTALETYMEESHQSDFYVRFYPEKEGILTIEEFEEISQIKEIQLAGVKAVIDTLQVGSNKRIMINAVLPAGTNKSAVLQAALANKNDVTKESYILCEEYNGDKLDANAAYTYYALGGKTYYTKNVTVATATGNTDASLSSVTIDGLAFADFDPKQLTYYEVEVNSETPKFNAVTVSDKSTMLITNPDAVPGVATIKVTAEAGNETTYTFNVIAGRSSDATLKNIYLNGKPLQGFSPSELYYRLQVQRIPQITAEVNDERSKLEILPVRTLPGYATLIVTAERGNQLKYSINFAYDKTCSTGTDTLTLGKSLNVEPETDYVRLFPVRDLSIDSALVRMLWTGSSELKIAVATNCDYESSDILDNIIDTVTIERDKGFARFQYDMYVSDLKAWSSQSVDGNVYLKVLGEEKGTLSFVEWEEDCLTMSTYFDVPASYNLNSLSFADMYKVFVSDWTGKDVRFTWSGSESMIMWVGRTCRFTLDQSSSRVIEAVEFETGSATVERTEEQLKDWLKYQNQGFIYVRLQTMGSGTLTTEIIPREDPGPPSAMDEAKTFNILNGEDGTISIYSDQEQQLAVYSITGALMWKGQTVAAKRVTISLQPGMYVVQGETQTTKVIVK